MIIKLPIIVTSVGVILHLLGVFSILKITSFEIDLIMLGVDILVAYGLIMRKKWGWNIALILFTQQSIMQPYWAYNLYRNNIYIIHPIELFIPTILVISSLIILIINKNSY
jgi:hypothetical protein